MLFGELFPLDRVRAERCRDSARKAHSDICLYTCLSLRQSMSLSARFGSRLSDN